MPSDIASLMLSLKLSSTSSGAPQISSYTPNLYICCIFLQLSMFLETMLRCKQLLLLTFIPCFLCPIHPLPILPPATEQTNKYCNPLGAETCLFCLFFFNAPTCIDVAV